MDARGDFQHTADRSIIIGGLIKIECRRLLLGPQWGFPITNYGASDTDLFTFATWNYCLHSVLMVGWTKEWIDGEIDGQMDDWMDGCERRWMDEHAKPSGAPRFEFVQPAAAAAAAATCAEQRWGTQINIGVDADYCETPPPINELGWIALKKCNGGSICFLNGRIDSHAVGRRLPLRLLRCPLAHLKKKKGAWGREGEPLIGNFLFWH